VERGSTQSTLGLGHTWIAISDCQRALKDLGGNRHVKDSISCFGCGTSKNTAGHAGRAAGRAGRRVVSSFGGWILS
jgi:hypothetical protein